MHRQNKPRVFNPYNRMCEKQPFKVWLASLAGGCVGAFVVFYIFKAVLPTGYVQAPVIFTVPLVGSVVRGIDIVFPYMPTWQRIVVGAVVTGTVAFVFLKICYALL